MKMVKSRHAVAQLASVIKLYVSDVQRLMERFQIKTHLEDPNSLRIYDEWLQLSIFLRQDWITSKQLVMFLDCPRYLVEQLHVLLPNIHKGDPYAMVYLE